MDTNRSSRAIGTAGLGAVLLLTLAVAAAAAPPLVAQEKSEAAEVQEREARLLFNTASRFYRQKNYREAAASFGEFLKRFPRHADAPDARFARGYSLNRLNQHAEAVEELRLAAAIEDHSWAADAHFYLGRSEEALAATEAAGSKGRRERLARAAASYGRAAALYASPPPAAPRGAADADAKNAPKSDPVESQVMALASQGEALYAAESYKEAAAALAPFVDKAATFEKAGQYTRGLYFLALAHYKLAEQGPDGSEGERAARDVLSRVAVPSFASDPLWFEAAFLLARLLHRSGDRAAAVERYNQIAERRGAHAEEAAYYRGLALYEMNSEPAGAAGKPAGDVLERAGEAFAGFVKLYPEHALAPRARFQEALCLFDRKRYDAAAAKLQAASEDGELAGLVSLRLGQCHLLKNPADPAAAAAALTKAVGALRARAAEPGVAEQLAEAVYWRGEALFAQGGDKQAEAALSFREVGADHRAAAPDLAEKALYQEARAFFLAGKYRESAAAARRYREAYGKEKGRFFAESLQVSAENALRAGKGELEEDERQAASRYYAEAASLVKDAAIGRRLLYLSGVAAYYWGDYRSAAEILERVLAEDRSNPLPDFREPDLAFFLADALAQEPRGEKLTAADQTRLNRAAALFQEYLDGSAAGTHAATALVNLGLAQKWLDDHGAARRSFAAFLETFPAHASRPEVRFELANAHLVLGDLQEAAAEYRRAAEEARRALEKNGAREKQGAADAPGNGGGEEQGPEAAASGKSASPAQTMMARRLLPARALLQAATLERRLGEPGEALAALEDLKREDETLAATGEEGRRLLLEAHYQQAAGLAEAGKKDDAKRAFAEHAERFAGGPHEAQARLQLAHLRLESKEAQAALEAVLPLASATPPAPEEDQALYLLAWCHRALAEAGGDDAAKHNGDMESTYRQLIAEHPGSDFALDGMLELGQNLFNRKAYAEARKYFTTLREAVEKKSRDGAAAPASSARWKSLHERCLFSLGFVAFEEKGHEEARGLFDLAAAAGDPALAARSLFQAGRAWMLSSGEKEAADRFRRLADSTAAEVGPYREESLLRLGECYHRLERYKDAVEVLEKLLADYPEGPLHNEGRFALGFANQFLNNFDAAYAAYRKVVAEAQGVVAARAQYHIGECLSDQGKPREAAREFLTVAANFDFEGPYREWVRRALLAGGIAYEAAGDAAASRAQLEELVKRFPESEEGKAAAERLAGEK